MEPTTETASRSTERSAISAAANRGPWLTGLLLFYLAASLLHFVHNAEYLADYPNLPAWLDRAEVYLVWLGLAAVGVGGYTLYRSGWRLLGLLLIGAYAASGFDGLLHYTRAPWAAHTATMNFTIWFEVLAAALLLGAVIVSIVRARERA
jgi:hypothetical protein